MKAKSKNSKGKVVCSKCHSSITPIVFMWNTKVCPKCNTIISSDKGIDKVS